jgi:hypothetical protein
LWGNQISALKIRPQGTVPVSGVLSGSAFVDPALGDGFVRGLVEVSFNYRVGTRN